MFVVEQRGTQFGDRGRGRVGVVDRGGTMLLLLLLLVVVIVVVVVAAAVGGGGGVVGGGDDTGCGGDGADVVRGAVSPLSAPRWRRLVAAAAGDRWRVVPGVVLMVRRGPATAPGAAAAATAGCRRLSDAVVGDGRDRRHVHASRPRYWSTSFRGKREKKNEQKPKRLLYTV